MRGSLAFVLAACMSAGNATVAKTANESRERGENPATVELAGTELRVTGKIRSDTVEKFEALLRTPAASNASTLRINSPGGEVSAGLRFAGLIRDRKLDVVVEQLCASSCALYVLPAAKRATFADGAIVTFHHMPSPLWRRIGLGVVEHDKTIDEATRARRSEALDRKLTRVMAEQETFYRSIGLDAKRIYRTMDIMFELRKRLRAAGKPVDANQASFVPGRQFLHECLGYTNVAWREFEPADSIVLARIGDKPVAFLIDGLLYFEGEPLSPKNHACEPRREPAPSAALPWQNPSSTINSSRQDQARASPGHRPRHAAAPPTRSSSR